MLKRGTHHSGKLQNHYNKYGASDLLFSFLLGCEESQRLVIEQYFIDAYNPWFNVSKFANRSFTQSQSEESNRKRSEKEKGKIPWNKGIKGSIPWNKGKKGCYSAEVIERMKNNRANQIFSHESNMKRGLNSLRTRKNNKIMSILNSIIKYKTIRA